MRLLFPIKYFEQNLVFHRDGSVYAYYEIQPFHYDFRSSEEQADLHRRLESLYWNMHTQTHMIAVPVFGRIEEHYQEVQEQLVPALHDTGTYHIQKSIDYLADKDLFQYRFFVGIELKKASLASTTLLKEFHFLWKDFKRYLINQSGTGAEEVFEEELLVYQQQEELVASRIRSYLHINKVTTEDIEWLIRRGFYRGIAESPKREGWSPRTVGIEVDGKKAKRLTTDILTLTEGRIDDSSGRHLVIEQHHEGKIQQGFTSFLTLSYIPDKSPFPGTEWLYCLQQLPFPVEVSLRTETIEYHRALSYVLSKKKELKAEDEHAVESGQETAYHILNSRHEASELENHLRIDKFPLVYTSVLLCVFASTLEELHMRIQLVKDLYRDMMIQVEIPYGDQWRGFNECLPGAKRYITDYCHYMEPFAVAASLVGAIRKLGDGHGHFIGMSKNMPVFFQHDRGPKDETLSSTASAAFIGSLGAGKSLSANLLAYQALLSGTRVLIFDPKDERGHWPDVLPELSGITRIVTLRASREDRGKLDPLIGARSHQEKVQAAETVKRILQFLCRAADGTYGSTAIGKAVDEVIKKEKKPSMMKVLEYLEEGLESSTDKKRERVEEMVDVLRYLSSAGQGQLLFGDGSQKAIDLSRHLTILQVEDLKLSDETQSDYGRMSTALLMAISDFCRRFSNQSSKQMKLVLFDEAWRLARVSEGRAILEELVRTGRSKNAGIYLISQNAKDLLGEEIRSNLGCRFIFRSRDQKEAEFACELLGIEPNESNQELVLSLPTGTCLMSDLEKRVNELTICVLDDRLLHAFDTRPGSNE